MKEKLQMSQEQLSEKCIILLWFLNLFMILLIFYRILDKTLNFHFWTIL